MNAGRPPVWRYSVRMSGVLGQKFGRKKSRIGDRLSSVRYCSSSHFVLRQAKYVYDCVKPSLARRYITLGRVNASDRKITSGHWLLIPEISHSQKGNGLVWGLSTRKIRTPCSIQNTNTLLSSS